MKNNKLLKILWGVVLAIFVVCIVFLGYSYFAGEILKNRKNLPLKHRIKNKIKILMRKNTNLKIVKTPKKNKNLEM